MYLKIYKIKLKSSCQLKCYLLLNKHQLNKSIQEKSLKTLQKKKRLLRSQIKSFVSQIVGR